jgi:hypothetical protein
MTTAAVDDGRRHRQEVLINMVGDGSGGVGAILVAADNIGQFDTVVGPGGPMLPMRGRSQGIR